MKLGLEVIGVLVVAAILVFGVGAIIDNYRIIKAKQRRKKEKERSQ